MTGPRSDHHAPPSAPSDASGPRRSDRAAQWIYTGIWRVLVDLFRVPDEPPTLPVRGGEHLESFRPARGFLAYRKLWFWIPCIAIAIAIAVGWFILLVFLWWLALILLLPALVIAIIPHIVAYIALHLRYDTTWYVMTDRSLRIRRGIWTIHETTITFENVQNLKVTQGPVQRYFGIANLIVETAGGGGGAGRDQSGAAAAVANRGIIEGVSDARRLRDMILHRVRRCRSAGLGDEDETAASAAGWRADHLAALREIRDELAALSP